MWAGNIAMSSWEKFILPQKVSLKTWHLNKALTWHLKNKEKHFPDRVRAQSLHTGARLTHSRRSKGTGVTEGHVVIPSEGSVTHHVGTTHKTRMLSQVLEKLLQPQQLPPAISSNLCLKVKDGRNNCDFTLRELSFCLPQEYTPLFKINKFKSVYDMTCMYTNSAI